MSHTRKYLAGSPEALEGVTPDLAELCRIHDVSLDLIERSNDLDDLLERILEEYEARLGDLPDDALDMRADSPSRATAKKLRALTTFASQAVALKVRSEEIERRHRLERLNEVLKTLSVLAHKINNPLTALLGRAQLLRAYPDADPKVLKTISVIEESATRIAELVKELAGVVKEGKREALAELLKMEGECEPPESRE